MQFYKDSFEKLTSYIPTSAQSPFQSWFGFSIWVSFVRVTHPHIPVYAVHSLHTYSCCLLSGLLVSRNLVNVLSLSKFRGTCWCYRFCWARYRSPNRTLRHKSNVRSSYVSVTDTKPARHVSFYKTVYLPCYDVVVSMSVSLFRYNTEISAYSPYKAPYHPFRPCSFHCLFRCNTNIFHVPFITPILSICFSITIPIYSHNPY